MIGAYMGWQLVLLTLFLSALVGTIAGVSMILAGQVRAAKLTKPLRAVAEDDPDPAKREKAQNEIDEIVANQTALSSQIPFGPYIVLAALIVFFFGPGLIGWYAGFFLQAPKAVSFLF